MEVPLKPLPHQLKPSSIQNPNRRRRLTIISKMKAVAVTSSGKLSLREVNDPPSIGDDEVLIKVAATALNRGEVPANGPYNPPEGSSPYPGLECSGTVLDAGRSVSRWKVGDQVCALLNGGGYAERVVVPAGQVLPIPEGVSLIEAASFPEVACTVWSTVFMMCRLSTGQTFLADIGSLAAVEKILSEFAAMSGLYLNKEKTKLYLNNCCRKKEELCETFGVALGQLPVKYLGLPLVTSKLKHSHCSTLLEKIQNQLEV